MEVGGTCEYAAGGAIVRLGMSRLTVSYHIELLRPGSALKHNYYSEQLH